MSTHKTLVEQFNAESSYDRNVFVMMRYRNEPHFRKIENAIRTAFEAHDLVAHLAKDRAYSDILWDNLRVYMDSCRYGIGVFEEIDEREFNPNVSLELGYMMAQGKRCLLLKESRMPRLPTDVCGFLYRDFDLFNIVESITEQINEWARDDLQIEGKRTFAIRVVAEIFNRGKTARDHRRQILLHLHSASEETSYADVLRAIYGTSERDEGIVRGDVIELMGLGVISCVKKKGIERFQLTSLGQDAVLPHTSSESRQ